MDEESVMPALLRAKMCRQKLTKKKKPLVCELLQPNILAQKTFRETAPSHADIERQRIFARNRASQKISNDYDAREKKDFSAGKKWYFGARDKE